MAKAPTKQLLYQRRRRERGDVRFAFWLPAEKAADLDMLVERFGSRAAAISHLVEQGLDQELAA